MEIIPAIDIIEGKCVRLTEGDYNQKKVYNEDPLEVAKQFQDAGLDRLHLVDLDGARTGTVKNWKVLEMIAGNTSLLIDFGGGLKTAKDIEMVFDSGAGMATIGSMAVKNENEFDLWLNKYGPARFFLGADVRNEQITVSGWQETTDIWIYDFIEKYVQKGIEQLFCTDVSKDGKLGGPATSLYKSILGKFPSLYLVASGGVSSVEDLVCLKQAGCKGVIIGKAIYENNISLKDLANFNKQ